MLNNKKMTDIKISAELVKELREKTGASIMECRNALVEAKGDLEKAVENLRKRGKEKAAKKADRATAEGVVVSYIHSNKKIGAMVELLCETDFVAKNSEFQELAYDLAMHITAMEPSDEISLLSQPFVKNPDTTVEDLIKEKIAKIGENIQIGNFVRFEI